VVKSDTPSTSFGYTFGFGNSLSLSISLKNSHRPINCLLKEDNQARGPEDMKYQAIFVRIITALLALVSTHLCSQQTPEQ